MAGFWQNVKDHICISQEKPSSGFVYWGGLALSIIFFLIWFWQLARLLYHYYKLNKHESFKNRDDKVPINQLYAVIGILMFSNLLYLFYESNPCNSQIVPLVVTLLYMLQIANMCTFKLINDDISDQMIPNTQVGVLKIAAITLSVVYALMWFISEMNAMKCSTNSQASGLIILFCIFFLWSLYVLYVLKKQEDAKQEEGSDEIGANPSLLGVNKDAVKNIAKESLNLALDMKKHDFDPEEMKQAQRKMFVLLQLATLGTAFIYAAVVIATNFWVSDISDPGNLYHLKCLNNGDDHKYSVVMRDSTVSQCLMCVLLSLPMQQFISCFYTVPEQYKYFERHYEVQQKQDDIGAKLGDALKLLGSAKLNQSDTHDEQPSMESLDEGEGQTRQE